MSFSSFRWCGGFRWRGWRWWRGRSWINWGRGPNRTWSNRNGGPREWRKGRGMRSDHPIIGASSSIIISFSLHDLYIEWSNIQIILQKLFSNDTFIKNEVGVNSGSSVYIYYIYIYQDAILQYWSSYLDFRRLVINRRPSDCMYFCICSHRSYLK